MFTTIITQTFAKYANGNFLFENDDQNWLHEQYDIMLIDYMIYIFINLVALSLFTYYVWKVLFRVGDSMTVQMKRKLCFFELILLMIFVFHLTTLLIFSQIDPIENQSKVTEMSYAGEIFDQISMQIFILLLFNVLFMFKKVELCTKLNYTNTHEIEYAIK